MIDTQKNFFSYTLYSIWVWLLSFLWIVFLTQGLTRGDLDEWALMFISERTPWRELIGNLLTPWCKSHFWFNQIDGFDQIQYKRIVNGILLKFNAGVFGTQNFPFYIFCKAIFFSGTVAIFFRIILEITCSLLYAIAGTLFFVLVPAHYSHVLWLSDPATVVQCFVIAGMWIFFHIAKNVESNGSQAEFLRSLALLFAVAWLGIKTKETALILPMVIGVFVLLRIRKWWPRKLELFLIGTAICLLSFQIIPIEHLDSVRQPFSYDLNNIGRMFFRNYGVGYDDEPASAFTSLDFVFPVSIARTLGFFMLWTVVLFTVLYRYFKRGKENSLTAIFTDHLLIVICIVWLLLEIALMGRFQPEVRFFSRTMIPLTILIVRLIYCVAQLTKAPWRFLIFGISIFSWVWSVFAANLGHVIWLRLQIGQRGNQFFNAAKFIYQDQFPDREANAREIAHFYIQDFLFKDRAGEPHIDDYTYHTELEYETWNKTKEGLVEDYEAYARTGAVYYITGDKTKFDRMPDVRNVYTLDNINHDSIFEKLLYRLKKKKPYPLYIFKFVPAP